MSSDVVAVSAGTVSCVAGPAAAFRSGLAELSITTSVFLMATDISSLPTGSFST